MWGQSKNNAENLVKSGNRRERVASVKKLVALYLSDFIENSSVWGCENSGGLECLGEAMLGN